jgi:hypothetical protein
MPCDDLTLHVITPYIPPRYHTWNQMLNTLILNELLLKKTLSTLSYRPKAMIAYSYARALWTDFNLSVPNHPWRDCWNIKTYLKPQGLRRGLWVPGLKSH